MNSGEDGTAITAVSDANYHFVNWSDASVANPRTDTNVTANISVMAIFIGNVGPSDWFDVINGISVPVANKKGLAFLVGLLLAGSCVAFTLERRDFRRKEPSSSKR